MRPNSFETLRLALIAGAILALAGCSRATSPVGAPPSVRPKSVVTGAVADTGGAAIAGATITLQDTHVVPGPGAARRPSPASVAHDFLVVTTAADGSYTFEPVPAGDYIVSADANGYVSRVVPVTLVTLGEPNTVDTVTVNIALTPAAPLAGARGTRR